MSQNAREDETVKVISLADAKDGQWLTVVEALDPRIRMQTLRFGIGAGSVIKVQKNINRGPVIVSKKQLEIAIGREIALGVTVLPLQK